MENTVKPGINLGNFLRELPKFFHEEHAFIKELIQNAWRSNAHRISIKFDNTMFSIDDDGHGIKNPQSLLTLAESDWSHQMADLQNPAGMGFWAAVFSATQVNVESKSNGSSFSILLNKELLTDLKDIRYEKDKRIKDGTSVVVHGSFMHTRMDIEIQRAVIFLQEAIDGKPLEIYVNDMKTKTINFLDEFSDQAILRKEITAGTLTVYGDNVYSHIIGHTGNHGRIGCHIIPLPLMRSTYRISIKPGGLTPRLPDRTAFVEDAKYKRFMKDLTETLAGLMIEGKLKITEGRLPYLPAEFKANIGPKPVPFEIDADVLDLPSDPWSNGIYYNELGQWEDEGYEFLLYQGSDRNDMDKAEILAACEALTEMGVKIGVTSWSKDVMEAEGLSQACADKIRSLDDLEVTTTRGKLLLDAKSIQVFDGTIELRDIISGKCWQITQGMVPVTETKFVYLGQLCLLLECMYSLCRLIIKVYDEDSRGSDAYQEEFDEIYGKPLNIALSPVEAVSSRLHKCISDILWDAGLAVSVESFEITKEVEGSKLYTAGSIFTLTKGGWIKEDL